MSHSHSLFQGTFDFNVETKIFPNHPELSPGPEEFVLMIDEAVKRHHLQSRVILQSFDFRTLRAMKVLDPSIRRSALFGEPKYDAMMGVTDPDKDFLSLGRKSEATFLAQTSTGDAGESGRGARCRSAGDAVHG